MDLEEYARYDGLGLAELVRKKEVRAGELGQLMLAGIDKVNPQINAVVETYTERVHSPDEEELTTGVFAGVPLMLKDFGASEAGKRQEMGSRLCKGFVADQDSTLITRFKKAGLRILGRTACPEFAFSTATESLLNGITCNPWNLERGTGGSSGGAAASVAAGILPLAHASDGLGSIRIPASACGLVGLKPSRGRVTLGPQTAETYLGMVQEFIVCKTTRDAAAMLDAVSYPAPGDPFVIVQPQRAYSLEVGAPTGRLHIAYTTKPWMPFPIDPEIVRAVEQVALQCEAMGHLVEEATPVYDHEEMMRAACVVWTIGFDVIIDGFAASLHREVSPETLEAVTLAFYEYARKVTKAEAYQAEAVFNKVRRSTGQFFENYDLLITPSLIQLPDLHGKFSQNVTDVDPFGFFLRCNESDIFMGLFNVTGQPAISLPLCQSKSGLPIGIQFAAHFGDEAALIRISTALEQAMPWKDRKPPFHVSR
jgi:amidase